MCFSRRKRASKSKVITEGGNIRILLWPFTRLWRRPWKSCSDCWISPEVDVAEMGKQNDFLQGLWQTLLRSLCKFMSLLLQGGPLPSKDPETIQLCPDGLCRMLSVCHLVVSSDCLHVTKWAKTARLMPEGAVFVSWLYFFVPALLLLHALKSKWSVKKIYLHLKIHHLDTLADGFGGCLLYHAS